MSQTTVPPCPNCDQPVSLIQPDGRRPGHLLGVCNARACGCWSAFVLTRGRLRPAARITLADRRSAAWPVARPAVPDTARRARA